MAVDLLNIEGLEDMEHQGPIVMVNLMRFRDRSLDGDGSGWDAYLRYSALTVPMIKARGGTLLWTGDAKAVALGPQAGNQWDYLALVYYPSVAAFIDMMTSADYESRCDPHRRNGCAEHVSSAPRRPTASSRWGRVPQPHSLMGAYRRLAAERVSFNSGSSALWQADFTSSHTSSTERCWASMANMAKLVRARSCRRHLAAPGVTPSCRRPDGSARQTSLRRRSLRSSRACANSGSVAIASCSRPTAGSQFQNAQKISTSRSSAARGSGIAIASAIWVRPPALRDLVEDGFEQASPRSELMIDSQPRHARRLGHRIQ